VAAFGIVATNAMVLLFGGVNGAVYAFRFIDGITDAVGDEAIVIEFTLRLLVTVLLGWTAALVSYFLAAAVMGNRQLPRSLQATQTLAGLLFGFLAFGTIKSACEGTAAGVTAGGRPSSLGHA